MQANRTLFFVIVGLALLVAIGVVIGGLFLANSSEEIPLLRPRVSIQVVVPSRLKPWVDQAAQRYNQVNAPTQVRVIAANELVPRAQLQSASPEAPVAAWLAEASFVVELARAQGVPLEDPQSLATTPLAWGGYGDKLAQFNDAYGEVNWENLHAKAVAPNDFLKLVIASPWDSAEGLAALLSATAAALGQEQITGNDISAANTWLTETLGDRNANIPPRPAETFASVQGRTLGDLGLLPLAAWQSAGLHQNSNFTILPAEPEVRLDYPYVLLTGSRLSPEAREAARSFRQFLLEPAQQDQLANFFFEPPQANPTGVQADAAAIERLLGWAERVLR